MYALLLCQDPVHPQSRAEFVAYSFSIIVSTDDANYHGPITPARMTIPPKPRIRNFPEPKSAIARVPPSHHEEEARSKVTSNAQSITISTCLCIMSSRHARERTDALSPPCPRSSSSSSQKSPCHRKTPSRKQATRKASERSVKDPYRKMLCNDP